ncbi:proteasome subunit alpha [Asanoa iriomotensis]|uniref:Proteasome subunit alpha n=1 Tax=Asanoa iriomotensis TaxID=234613 RepID=A0ABQ4CA71_9ACTN|nr:proteasome subunit alpha [Asanoa iriomotensis]GIF59667.1 proteasome subunit alpha [Asanoa iriomotensis]
MAMQFYTNIDQIMRDRSELARKGISRGRSAVTLTYAGGILFVAENLSSSLHKISEIYDRIGFAAVGRYNEFENLRRAGVRKADLDGLSYDRRDVTGLALANAYAQTLGAIFSDQQKPFEVEICVAEVGPTPAEDQIYRLAYDGSVNDEPGYMAMGGSAEAIANVLKGAHKSDMSLTDAVKLAVKALSSVGGDGGASRTIAANQLEVAILDRARRGRTFRRLIGPVLTNILDGNGGAAAAAAPKNGKEPTDDKAAEGTEGAAKPPAPGPDKPTSSAGSADLE